MRTLHILQRRLVRSDQVQRHIIERITIHPTRQIPRKLNDRRVKASLIKTARTNRPIHRDQMLPGSHKRTPLGGKSAPTPGGRGTGRAGEVPSVGCVEIGPPLPAGIAVWGALCGAVTVVWRAWVGPWWSGRLRCVVGASGCLVWLDPVLGEDPEPWSGCAVAPVVVAVVSGRPEVGWVVLQFGVG